MVLLLLDGERVVITNGVVHKFLSVNAGNEALLKACEDILVMFCTTADDFMSRHTSLETGKRETNTILAYLQSMERKQSELQQQMEHRISEVGVSVADRVSSQVANLIVMVDKAITASVDRLNIDSIACKLNVSIKDWLDGELKQTNSDVKGSLHALEVGMRDQVSMNLSQQLVAQQELLRQVSMLPTQLSGVVRDSEMQKLLIELSGKWSTGMDALTSNMRELEGEIGCVARDAAAKWLESKELSALQQASLGDQIKAVPMMARGVLSDVLRQLEQESHNVSLAVQSALQQLCQVHGDVRDSMSSVAVIRNSTDEVKARLETLDKQLLSKRVKESNSNSIKGADGEDVLVSLLQERLMTRDGYVVDKVSGMARSADIVIKRRNYATVRIECKNHGKETGEKVRQAHVDKFVRDMMDSNDHGIFVSLHTGIVGKGALEIERLATGKIAVYLSENNYNIDVIIDMVQLIYMIDGMMRCTEDDNGGSKFSITSQTMTRVQNMLKDFGNKVASIKAHLKESMSLLGELMLGNVEVVLLSEQKAVVDSDAQVDEIRCPYCSRSCGSKAGLGAHKRVCKARGAELQDVVGVVVASESADVDVTLADVELEGGVASKPSKRKHAGK